MIHVHVHRFDISIHVSDPQSQHAIQPPDPCRGGLVCPPPVRSTLPRARFHDLYLWTLTRNLFLFHFFSFFWYCVGGTTLERAARGITALATPDRCAYVNLAVPSGIRPGCPERWPWRADLNIFRHPLFNHHIFRAFLISRTVNLSSPQDFNEKKIWAQRRNQRKKRYKSVLKFFSDFFSVKKCIYLYFWINSKKILEKNKREFLARICSAFCADFSAVLRFLGRARHKK